ncbi:MAG: hypothetical protein QOG71_2345 [Pyrinomonadaceae bacterium]|nr:hypothetical protein [Pyrinomonadaceae bacterium]
MPAKLAYPTKDLEMADGQILHWTRLCRPTLYWMVPFSCPIHNRERLVPASVALRPGFNQLCLECLLINPPWMHTHEQVLPKGTKVLFHRRAKGNNYKVAIECHGCFKEVGEIKYVQYQTIFSYIKGLIAVLALVHWAGDEDAKSWLRLWPHLKFIKYWSELCADCRRGLPSYKKFTTDKENVNGAIIQFSQEKDAMVPVFHPTCQHTVWKKRGTARSHWNEYFDICFPCQRAPRALAARMKELGSNGHKNRSEDKEGDTAKRRGRKPGTTGFDHDKFPTEVNAIILKLWKQKQSIVAITKKAVADEFHEKGERLSEWDITNRLKICGINEKWPSYRESVIKMEVINN